VSSCAFFFSPHAFFPDPAFSPSSGHRPPLFSGCRRRLLSRWSPPHSRFFAVKKNVPPCVYLPAFFFPGLSVSPPHIDFGGCPLTSRTHLCPFPPLPFAGNPPPLWTGALQSWPSVFIWSFFARPEPSLQRTDTSTYTSSSFFLPHPNGVVRRSLIPNDCV